MNPAAQRARHTAVATAEKRIDDLEIVIMAFATEVVRDRATTTAALADVRTAAQARDDARQRAHETLAGRLERGRVHLADWEHQTLRQRLRWLVWGV